MAWKQKHCTQGRLGAMLWLLTFPRQGKQPGFPGQCIGTRKLCIVFVIESKHLINKTNLYHKTGHTHTHSPFIDLHWSIYYNIVKFIVLSLIYTGRYIIIMLNVMIIIFIISIIIMSLLNSFSRFVLLFRNPEE